MSGEDEYDVMMLPVSEAPEPHYRRVSPGILKSMPEFKFDGEWWDQEIIGATTFDNRLGFGPSGAANLMAFDSMWCLFFNENMAENHQLDMPYDLVREGKWTIDEATKYAKAVSQPERRRVLEVVEGREVCLRHIVRIRTRRSISGSLRESSLLMLTRKANRNSLLATIASTASWISSRYCSTARRAPR